MVGLMDMGTLEAIRKFSSLRITHSEGSSQNDFDFLVGKWNVHNRKLKERLVNSQDWLQFDATSEMEKILNGLGSIDRFFATFNGDAFERMTLRLFNPETRLWSVYWSDNRRAVLDIPVVGSFDNSTGTFYANDVFNGKKIAVMFKWDKSIPDKPVWSRAFSQDRGRTWEWNWYMSFTRQH